MRTRSSNNLGRHLEAGPPRSAIGLHKGKVCLALAVLAGVLLAGCSNAGTSRGSYPVDWFTEMHYHQSFKIQEPPSLSAPSEAVPAGAWQGVGYVLDLSEPLAWDADYTLEQVKELRNPLPGNDATVALGAGVFQTNCAVCHGPAGLGDGPMVQRLDEAGYSPRVSMDLTAAGPTFEMPDGEFYQIVTRGYGETYFPGRLAALEERFRRGELSEEQYQQGRRNLFFVMPAFAKLLTSTERWALVHYIRSIQGQ